MQPKIGKPIFIHVPRTGGNTVRYQYRDKFDYHSHYTATQIRDRDTELFDAAWKFAFVRNPWDRMVSLYYHFHQSKHIPMQHNIEWQREHFHEWFNHAHPYVNRYNLEWIRGQTPGNMLFIDGELVMDQVFKFENMREAHMLICEQLSVPWFRLPRRKASRRDWKVKELVVDQADIDAIAEIGTWEIERCGYEFN